MKILITSTAHMDTLHNIVNRLEGLPRNDADPASEIPWYDDPNYPTGYTTQNRTVFSLYPVIGLVYLSDEAIAARVNPPSTVTLEELELFDQAVLDATDVAYTEPPA